MCGNKERAGKSSRIMRDVTTRAGARHSSTTEQRKLPHRGESRSLAPTLRGAARWALSASRPLLSPRRRAPRGVRRRSLRRRSCRLLSLFDRHAKLSSIHGFGHSSTRTTATASPTHLAVLGHGTATPTSRTPEGVSSSLYLPISPHISRPPAARRRGYAARAACAATRAAAPA